MSASSWRPEFQDACRGRRAYNKALLRAAVELAPVGMEIRVFERLSEIPLYNEDVEKKGDPEPVAALKTAIREADTLLIATPEYNYGIPVVVAAEPYLLRHESVLDRLQYRAVGLRVAV